MLAGSFVADVGFGNLTPTGPIAIRPGEAQTTPLEPFRLMPKGEDLMMEARLGDVWDSLCYFSLEAANPVDYEVANWFTSTHPASPFIDNLIVAQLSAQGRMTLFNRRFMVRDRDNHSSRRILHGSAEYRDILIGQFGIALDDVDIDAIATLMAGHPETEDVLPSFR